MGERQRSPKGFRNPKVPEVVMPCSEGQRLLPLPEPNTLGFLYYIWGYHVLIFKNDKFEWNSPNGEWLNEAKLFLLTKAVKYMLGIRQMRKGAYFGWV